MKFNIKQIENTTLIQKCSCCDVDINLYKAKFEPKKKSKGEIEELEDIVFNFTHDPNSDTSDEDEQEDDYEIEEDDSEDSDTSEDVLPPSIIQFLKDTKLLKASDKEAKTFLLRFSRTALLISASLLKLRMLAAPKTIMPESNTVLKSFVSNVLY